MLTLYASQANAPKIFVDRAKSLQVMLGDSCSIEHVGSTAVPGVEGKGIIDILIGFNTPELLKNAPLLLQGIGYSEGKNNKRKDYIFMASSKNETTLGDIHLHLTLKTTKTYDNFIKIRDYFRQHPDAAKEYSELKYKIAQECNFDREVYRQKKGAYIKKIIRAAS